MGHVLVVDDEGTLLGLYLRVLKEAGFAVEGAEDGARAAALLRERTFDVIVSDISMPGMDGLTLLKTVRERDLDVPVILMTGSPAVETAVQAVELGAMRYLVKPFSLDLLVTVVGQAQRIHRIAKLRRQAVELVGTGNRQLGDRTALETSFERAMGSLWMAYQPIVSCARREIHAFEALLRSGEPTLPTPGSLLEAAERLGRLEPLGRAIRDRVAASVGAAPSKAVFVNLHTSDLLDEALYSPTAPLSKVAAKVVLEITERASLDEVVDVRTRVASLRKLGFRLAVDDLGAGYAGLTCFAQIEPEVVKFDMSLIRDLASSATRQKLIRSMTGLFKEMNITSVAEGVETAAERDAVLESGCDFIQGYLFSKPGREFPTVAW
jgi:EAL domain-containing protein (putative c-di-GMP-specific phosphodiesterase class I)/ActR/RegA family two-component response regulator